jgi:hypothetical protein
MCEGVVIDAHLLLPFRKEYAQGNGPLLELFVWLLANCRVARTALIEQHWTTKIKATDELFWNWYREQIEKKAIRDVPLDRLPKEVKRKLRSEYKLPKDMFVLGYLECAFSTTAPRYILSEDMYLHEPQARSLDTGTQADIREARRGKVCKYLEDELGITVGTVTHCRGHFPVQQSSCPQKTTDGRPSCKS